jgi:hypothetical protein
MSHPCKRGLTKRMLPLARAIAGVVSDVLRLGVLFLRSSNAIRAENWVLRRQLARFIECGIKPRHWILVATLYGRRNAVNA